MAKGLLYSIWFLTTSYIYGVLGGIVFYLLRALDVIRLYHWKRFPHWERKLILASNHPSLLDPFILPALFLHQYFFYPFRFGPWSTPDAGNFYNRWYFFWLRARSIPVDRKSNSKKMRALFRIRRTLESGQVVILFPEGGRTFKGKRFFYSQQGKKIRPLQTGIGWLVSKTGASVLPVWVEGTDDFWPNSPDRLFCLPKWGDKIIIKIGKPLRFSMSEAESPEKITQTIADAILKLADE